VSAVRLLVDVAGEWRIGVLHAPAS
jgi:hypothetical protein